ncbi:MAG: DUF6600 domain-containing protein [Candidatus Acidiferrales bacterium]
MKKHSPFAHVVFAAVAILLGLSTASAARAQDDPPGRVARISFMSGSVSYQISGDQDWVQADPNHPLTTGDNLWADKDSRAEVHVGATAIRLSNETGISLLNLDDRTVQVQLAQGTIEVHLRHLSPGDAYEIDTPNLAFSLQQPGEYRIQTDPDGNSTIIVVREGQGLVTGGGETYTLDAGNSYTISGTDQLTYDTGAAPGFDDFENWCQNRDQVENNAVSAQYVSRDVDGYYDLDANGDWSNDNDYGAVWYPHVAAGWVPYHYGHWIWVGPWGWTWVEDESWGFAPFHYGRWAYVGTRWGWVPGPVVVRPVYAPALVGFVGGGGFSMSVTVGFGGGFAGVAWFPLGPRDVYVPGYHCSPRYVQNINITNSRVINATRVTNVYNTTVVNKTVVVNNYTYEKNATAVTAVSRDTFINARPVGRESVRVTSDQLSGAHVVENTPLAPTQHSYVSSEVKAATARPKVAFEQRAMVARLSPAVPVSRQQQAFTNDSRPFNQEPAPAVRAETETQAHVNANVAPSKTVNGQNAAAPPPARDNFDNNRNQPAGTNRNARPAVTFAPPARAKDENYDVHPALNRPEPKPAPKASSTPKSESHKPPK